MFISIWESTLHLFITHLSFAPASHSTLSAVWGTELMYSWGSITRLLWRKKVGRDCWGLSGEIMTPYWYPVTLMIHGLFTHACWCPEGTRVSAEEEPVERHRRLKKTLVRWCFVLPYQRTCPRKMTWVSLFLKSQGVTHTFHQQQGVCV